MALAESGARIYDAGVRQWNPMRDAVCLGLSALLLGCVSAQEPAPPPPPPPFELIGEWGERGEGPGKLRDPSAIAVDPDGLVYISDIGSRMVHKFSPEGRPLLSIELPGKITPYSLAVDSGGAIYVTDGANIVILYPDGRHLRTIRGGKGRAIQKPLDVVVDADGNLFVSEHYGSIVHKVSPLGRVLKSWGGWKSLDNFQPGEFRHVLGLGIGSDGVLYLADVNGSRVQKFTRDGELVEAWPSFENTLLKHWSGMVVGARHVFLLDMGTPGGVHVLDLNGRHVVSDSLGGRVKGSDEGIPRAAWSPRGELLILIPEGKVLRYRVSLP